jgi:hypothetical protein
MENEKLRTSIRTILSEFLNESKSDITLDFIINDFFNYIKEFEYLEKYNMCDVFIYEFIEFIEDRYDITDYKIIQLNHYKLNTKNTPYENIKPKNIYHIVLQVYDKYIDLTPEQFGILGDYNIYSLSDIKNQFININKITKDELYKFCRGKFH